MHPIWFDNALVPSLEITLYHPRPELGVIPNNIWNPPKPISISFHCQNKSVSMLSFYVALAQNSCTSIATAIYMHCIRLKNKNLFPKIKYIFRWTKDVII